MPWASRGGLTSWKRGWRALKSGLSGTGQRVPEREGSALVDLAGVGFQGMRWVGGSTKWELGVAASL
jgi:hypothetical protein